jgi:hypothetical protein
VARTAEPRGYLHLVPWERLLERLGRPLLRLPNHTLRPRASGTALQVGLCVHSPAAARAKASASSRAAFDPVPTVELAARLWQTRFGRRVTIHVFTDADSHDTLARDRAALGPAVLLHEPLDIYRVARDRAAGTNPWLRWMGDSLDTGLDVLHCVTPGFLTGGRGAIALETLVGAAELCAFVSRVGAWSVVLSGPAGSRHSPAGLRELADAVAQVQPGVIVANEFATDHDGEQLGRAMAMAYGASPVTYALGAVTCWSHPKFVEYPPQTRDALLLTGDGGSSLIQSATQAALDRDETPVWVSACVRFLETQQAQWLPDADGEPVDGDAVTALTAVSDLVERHVRRHLGGGS